MKSQKTERRAWVRYATEQDACYRVLGKSDDKIFAARIQDVSATGLGLLANYTFTPGTILNVQVESRNGSRVSRPLLVRVRQSNAQSDGIWLLGCKLVTELDDRELDALIEA